MKRYLMTPGPTEVPPDTLLAMARPVIHHRTPEFHAIMKETIGLLKYVFQTKGDVFVLAGSGTSAMEACIANTIRPGGRVLCVRTGKFGERWTKIVKTFNGVPVNLDVEWGRAVNPSAIAKALNEDASIRAVCCQHCDTSTGVANDIKAIGEITRNTDTLLIVDGVSAAGALEFRMDEWGVDMLASGSQKALMMAPGLAFIAASPKAMKSISADQPCSFYFDINKMKKFAEADDTPFTPAITLVYGQLNSLKMIRAEGIENVWSRHAMLGRACRAAAEAIGLKVFSQNPSDCVTAVLVPDGINGTEMIKSIEARYGIKFADGQDSLKGRVIRIGTMGYCGRFDVISFVAALEMSLVEAGVDITLGAGVQAAEQVFLESNRR